MAVEVLEPFLKGSSGRNTRGLLRLIILCTIAAAAVASRLFSVIRKSYNSGSSEELKSSTTLSTELQLIQCGLGFESIIHECSSTFKRLKILPGGMLADES